MRLARLPLSWRLGLLNGLVLATGGLALAFSPATVSAPVQPSEVLVLALGLVAVVLVNLALVRRSLAPLDRLVRAMEVVDLDRPGERLPRSGAGVVPRLVETFNDMRTRLEHERRATKAGALAAQEAERHRIAQELHDEIGQGLTAVLLGLARAAETAPEPLASDLAALREGARSSLEEVRRVARRLRPGVLDDLGLHSALSALATETAAHSGVFVRRQLGAGLPELSPDRELVVYRVAQEALTNVVRHSGADTAELTLVRRGDAVVLEVVDNGRGIRTAAPGSGLSGMHERALLVDGQLEVVPGRDRGTCVRLVVPLEAS